MKSKRAVLIGLMASLPALAGAAEPTDRPSPTDPRGWRAVLGSEARQSHVLRPGVELFFTGENERVVAVLRVAGAAANEGVIFTVPGASGYTKSYNGHVRLTVPGGDLAFVRPGAVQDDGTGLKPVFAEWAQAGPAGVKLVFPGHEGKLPLLVRFEVLFLADAKAQELYDKNGDGRIDLNELTPLDAPQAEAPEGSPVVSASLVDAFVVDNGTAGQANPGDVIGYTATIDSTGTTATALAYNNPIDPDTTLVPGSVNVAPLALNDSYNAVGNVTLDVDTAPAGLFGNDREFPFGPSTFTLATAGPNAGTQLPCGSFPCTVTTQGGGTVILKSPGDGRFTYTSPAALPIPGTDSFVYVITDGVLTDSATVTFNVNGRVWFVDRDDATPPFLGTQQDPFNALSPTTVAGAGGGGDVDGPNDIIYLHDRPAATDYTGGLELEASQRLVGSGVPLIISGTQYLPATTPPVLENTGGNALTLLAGVTVDGRPHVEGLTVNAANNAAIAGSGALATLTLDAVTINTSASGAGLSLTNQTGTLTFSNGSIGGTGTGAALLVNGGAGSVTLSSAAIGKTAGRLVDVQNKTGGTVTLDSVSGTGAATDALVVQSNTGGSVVAFPAGFSVTTTAGRGLFANNGGTINVTGTSSTIAATGGAALDVTGTSFGTGVTLTSASSTGSSAEGVRLSNVTGPVTINGGAISGSTGTAFNLSQGSANVTYAGTISKTSAGRAVDVQTRAGGTAAFSGAITATGASTGINVSGATAVSTVNFTGAVDLGTGGTPLTGGTALTLNHGGNASVTSFSDLDVVTTGQQGINASNGGTFNVTTGSVNAGGRALNLDGLALGATFGAVASSGSASEGIRLNAVTGSLTHASTSVTAASTQGISVAGSSANVTFASGGNTTVSGSTTQGILVGTSTGTIAFGNTTVSGGTDGVSLQNNSSGSRTFGTLTVNSPGAVGFLHGAGGGAVTVSGAATIATPTGAGVQIEGNGATAINFNSTLSVNKTNAGTGVLLGTVTTNGGTVNLGTLSVTTSNGAAIVAGSATTTTPLTTAGAGVLSATNGPAINARGTVFAASFGNVSSATGTNGLSLHTCGGALTMSGTGGTITGSTGTAVAVTNGTLTATYAGNVTQNNAQRVVDVQATTSGTISLTGTVTGGASSTGVNINSANGNVSFGTLNLGTIGSRTGNQAVTILNGTGTYSLGTVGIFTTGAARGIVSTNADGTLNSTAGTVNAAGAPAVDIDGPAGLTTLGMTLTSVHASGGNSGIRIQDTNGAFGVAGDGGGANNASGGTIQNTTAEGVFLNATAGISLGYMDINNSGTDSIRITNINGFTLNRSNISDAAGTTADKAIDIGDFSTGTAVNGSINLTNDVIGPAAGSSPHDSLAAGISSGTSTWAMTNTTIRNTGNSGINLELRGSAVVTAFNVNNCTFAGAGFATSARGVFANNLDDSVMTLLTVQNSTFTNNNIHTDFNQQNDTDPVGSGEFAMLNNTTMTGARSHAMNIFAAAGSFAGTFQGTTSGNSIGNAGVPDSGSAIGNGIRVNVNGGSDATQLLNGNTVRQAPNGRGVEIIGRNGTGGLDITVTNNNVNPQALANPLAAILVQSNCLTTCNTVRSDVRSNTVPAATDVTDLLNTYIQLVESGASTSELVDSTAPISGTCASELAATNTGSTGVLGGCALIAGPIAVP